MEAIGLVGFILQALGAVVKSVEYLNDVRDAPKERAKLSQEIQSLLVLLTELRTRVEAAKPDDPWFASVRSLGTPTGPLAQLRDAMNELTGKLARKEKFGRALLWTMEKGALRDTFAHVERLKATITMAMQMDHV